MRSIDGKSEPRFSTRWSKHFWLMVSCPFSQQRMLVRLTFAWSGCTRDVREAFLCIRLVEQSIWHLFQTDFTEIMLLLWDVFLLFHTFFRLYNAGQMFFGGASSKKNHSWRLKRKFYGTQCQQAMFSSIQKHFLRCKMLVGLCPNPLCSASVGCRLRDCIA